MSTIPIYPQNGCFRVNCWEMRQISFLPILLFVLAASVYAQGGFAGRWDMTVTPQSGDPYPQWMEITQKDGKLEGRLQPRGGAWRPLVLTGYHQCFSQNVKYRNARVQAFPLQL